MPQNSANITVNNKDYQRLVKKLRKLGAIDADFKKAFAIEGKNAVARMERSAPHKTGRLRRNIEYKATTKGIEIESRAIDPQTRIDYAPIQELPPGTMPFRTTPYYWRNIRQMQRKLFYRFNDIITDIIKRR